MVESRMKVREVEHQRPKRGLDVLKEKHGATGYTSTSWILRVRIYVSSASQLPPTTQFMAFSIKN